jgi:hypothetical protein
MADTDADPGEIVIARDYDQDAVVVETPNNEQRLAPAAARNMAKGFRTAAKMPGNPAADFNRVADEIMQAADDVEADS